MILQNAVQRLMLTLLLTCSIANINLIYAQPSFKHVDSLIRTVFKDSLGPGGIFMVAINGKPIYQKAVGKANIELDVNLTIESVFQIGSMTKQFTSVAILMLEQEGKLSTSDPISKYISDYPNGANITIHHLLTHTSGIKDFTAMKSIKNIAQKEMLPAMLVDFFKNEPEVFAPGAQFEYNNSGYVLLGYLIELVSGQSYEDYIQGHIFKKLGMQNSRYASDRKIIANRAYGYQLKESGYVNRTIINYSIPYASGALMSTAGDMLIWQNSLKNHILLNDASLQKAFRSYQLNNGKNTSYGYGWHIRDIDGTSTYEHGGSIFGYKSMAVYVPSKDIYVLGLTNCDSNSPTTTIQEIARHVISNLSDSKL